MVEMRVLCWEVSVDRLDGWQRKGIRRGCGDVRRTFGVVSESCRVLPDSGFVSGVKVLVVVLCSVQVLRSTCRAVLARRHDLRGNCHKGGEQRQKHLQMKPRDLLVLVMLKLLELLLNMSTARL